MNPAINAPTATWHTNNVMTLARRGRGVHSTANAVAFCLAKCQGPAPVSSRHTLNTRGPSTITVAKDASPIKSKPPNKNRAASDAIAEGCNEKPTQGRGPATDADNDQASAEGSSDHWRAIAGTASASACKIVAIEQHDRATQQKKTRSWIRPIGPRIDQLTDRLPSDFSIFALGAQRAKTAWFSLIERRWHVIGNRNEDGFDLLNFPVEDFKELQHAKKYAACAPVIRPECRR